MIQAMSDQTPSSQTPTDPYPPPYPPDEDPTRPGARERTLRRQLIAWLSLGFFCLAAVMSDAIVQLVPMHPKLEDVSDVSSFQIEVVGRFSLGARQVLGAAMGSGELQMGQLRDLAKSLDQIASMHDPRLREIEYVHRFRAVVLLAEFAGAQEGIKQIDAMLDTPGVPESLIEDGRLMRRVYESGADSLTPDEKDRLIDRHGWIGRLGVSFGQPPDAPERAIVLRAARVTFFGLMGLFTLALLALPVGFTLFIVAAILLANGRIRPRYHPDRDSSGPRHTAFLESVSLFLGALALLKIAGAFLDRANLDNPWVEIAGLALYVLQWAMLLTVFWPLLRGVSARRLVRGLGWIPGRGVFREFGAGLVGYLAGLPLLLIGFLLMFVLIIVSGIEPSHPIVERAGKHDILNILFIYSIAVIWAPLVEESIFRGAFYHHLRRWLGPVLSALIVAFVFAGLHPQGFVAMPPLMALAFIFAMIREWRGSLFGCMAAHAMHNGILMTVNIFFLACLH